MALLHEYDKRQQLLQPAVHAINSMLGLPSCIWLLDESGKTLRIAAAAELLDEYVGEAYLQIDEPCIAAKVFEKKKTIIVSDINTESQWKYRKEFSSMGLRSAIVIPLWVKRNIVGILDMYIPKDQDVDYNTKIPAIEDFAVQIGVTLRQVQGLETLNEVGNLMNLEIKGFRNLLEQIMQAAQKVLVCEHVSIFLVENDELIRKASSSTTVKREHFKLGEGLAGHVAQKGKSLLVMNTLKYPNFLPGLSSGNKERSMLLVPITLFMQSKKQTIGVISADRDEINGFDQQDLLFMETLSKQTAVAIHNFQLFEIERKRREEIERLRKIEQRVSSQTDLEKVIGTVLDELKNVVDYKRASVQMIQGDHRFIIGDRDFLLDETSPILLRDVSEDKLIHKIVQNREIYVLSDVDEESLWNHVPDTADVHSWICAPLIVDAQVIGLLTIDHPEAGHYSQRDGKKVARFANQVAAEIYRSNFFQTIRNQAEALTELNKLTYELLYIREIIDIRKLLQRIADTAKEVLKADLIGLYEYREAGKFFDFPSIFAGQMYVAIAQQKELSESAAILQLINQQEPVYVHDTRNNPIFSTPYPIPREGLLEEKERFAVREKIQSTAVIPLRAGDETLGLMFVNYRKPQAFLVEQREIIQLFANQAAIAIRNARLFARLNATNQRQKALIKVGEDLTSKIELQEQDILQLLEVQARVALGIENLTVTLYDEQSEIIRFVQASRDGVPVKVEEEKGWEPRQKGKGGKGKTEWIIDNRKPLLLSSAEEFKECGFSFSPIPGDSEYAGRLPNAWLGVPMIFGEKVLGVITTYHFERDLVFVKDDIEILQALADQAVVALDNTRNYARLCTAVQQQKALIEVGKDLASKIEFQEPEILELIEVQAREALGIENLTIALYDESNEIIRFVQASRDGRPVNVKKERGWESHPRGKGGRGKTEWIIENKKYLLLSSPDDMMKWGFSPDPGDLEYKGPFPNSWLGVPLMLGKKVLGVITTYHYKHEHSFTKDDIDVLQALADQAAVALDNARLYEEIQKSEIKYRELVQDSNSIIIRMDKDGRFTFVNDFAQKHFGYNENELLGQSVIGTIIPEKDSTERDMGKMIEEIIQYPEQYASNINENMRKNGERIWTVWTNRAILNDEGELFEIVCVGNDITDRKRIEDKQKALIDLTQKLTSTIQLREDEICVSIRDHASNIMDTNNMYIALYDESTATIYFSLVIVSKLKFMQQAFESLKHENIPQAIWENVKLLENREFEIGDLLDAIISFKLTEQSLENLRNEGIHETILKTLQPIINQKVTGKENFLDIVKKYIGHEQTVQYKEQLLKQANTSKGESKEKEQINYYMEQVLKHAVVLSGKPINITEREEYRPRKFDRDNMGKTEAIIHSKEPLFHPTKEETEQWYKEPGHQEFWGYIFPSWLGVPMVIGGKVLGVIATYHPTREHLYSIDDLDILQAMANSAAIALANARLVSDLKNAQNEIADRERALVMSGLAMDFAHRMNNTAGTIPQWVTLIQRELSGKSKKKHTNVDKYLNNIRQEVLTILEEANNLRKPIAEYENVDMNEIIGSIVGQVEMMTSPNIEINFDPKTSLFSVCGAKQQLSVAIDSIVRNAVKSIEGQGKIVIRLENVVKVIEDKNFVEITITDTGCGIPEDKRQSIFEYGKSYWRDKKGTGYGLWRAHSIIQNFGGHIKVSSPADKGTEFTILLPAAVPNGTDS